MKIHEALFAAGVTLVSATESIDQTPSGMLVHGIMSSIAEFYSRNLATDVTKGLTQKVAQGGTPMRAPIGYLNVRKTDEQGREIRTVEVERAPLIRWAFQQYATGETSVTGLPGDLTAKVDAAFDKRMAGRDQEIADLMANRVKLEAESDKLLAAHFADAIDLPTLKRHQDRIRAGLADVNRRLAEHDEHHTGGRAFLHDSLRLLTDDEQLRARLADPFVTIIREAHQHNDDGGEEPLRAHNTSTHVACSRKTL